ncbi:hypothetical protein LshimejAT787_1701210 [Lyophyllum shimeji]|uniref:Uncharacterized protein n=1 Tax=Lyophyllum shimeji TaxID=47721 RepID=A0A9P3PZJ7_LYOSH|nr:hypothetical protein LshimejAT787_1701210 [Lyophyllum shimeji]
MGSRYCRSNMYTTSLVDYHSGSCSSSCTTTVHRSRCTVCAAFFKLDKGQSKPAPLSSMLPTLCFATVLGAATLFYYHNSTGVPTLTTNMDTQSWSSAFASWHSRALLRPHPSPHAFTPTRDALQLAVLLNAPVEHEGITLALFSQATEDGSGGETVAVDALGRVLIVTERDAAGMLGLAEEVLALPPTGAFRNTWFIKHPYTSQPIDRLFIPSSGSAADLHQVSVQGFSKKTRELKTPVEGIIELPRTLWELAGLVLEAREDAGHPGDERRDEVVLGKVREVVRELF